MTFYGTRSGVRYTLNFTAMRTTTSSASNSGKHLEMAISIESYGAATIEPERCKCPPVINLSNSRMEGKQWFLARFTRSHPCCIPSNNSTDNKRKTHGHMGGWTWSVPKTRKENLRMGEKIWPTFNPSKPSYHKQKQGLCASWQFAFAWDFAACHLAIST